ncbi:pre-B-cell leukemia homeobox interacting protein 1b [Brachionichthys hirsutus]|uniref:pre-B-cell leukemia homeobox interacting protein 1b n=1 Tax=Brachionichthys hirsutus TaxID=412623 RepID=UPI00360502D5
MSAGSSSNSWTVVSPEETVAETLRPSADEVERREESRASESGVSEGRASELSGETPAERDAPAPTQASEVSNISQSRDLPESGRDPDSVSDSYTHINPSSDAPPATLLSPETIGGVEFTQQEGIQHPLSEEVPLKEVEPDRSPEIAEGAKQTDSPADSEVGEQRTDKAGEELEQQVRRRRSLLASLERIGRTEEVEEEFQLPRQEGDGGFSLNKCILGALILLGLGTIFFSGVFLDLDEEGDLAKRLQRDTEVPEKQEWLHPEVSPGDAELQNKFKENEQMSVLEARLQSHGFFFKRAQMEALNEAEGAKERLRWEEVEKENSRLKKENEKLKRELESVLALKQELETLRSSLPELKPSSAQEAVHAPVSPTAAPPSGQPQDSPTGTTEFTQSPPGKPQNTQIEKKRDVKKGGHNIREKEGKEKKRSDVKEGEKKHKERGKSEWKNGRHEQGKLVKEKDKEGKQNGHSGETKHMKVEDWKDKRGDQGKSWKDREEKSDRIRPDERDRKIAKHEGKHWTGEGDKKVWKEGKEHGEGHQNREEWKGERERKKGKDGYKESGKDKGERREWKKDDDWRGENSKEGKWKGDRKRWEENRNHGNANEGKDERKQWSENEWESKSGNNDKEWKRKEWEEKEERPRRGGEKERKDWIKDRTSSHKHKEHKSRDRGHEEERPWGDRKPVHARVKPSLERPEYWIHRRQRFQHSPKPPQQCPSAETCAEAEGLRPVPRPEFEAILQAYLDEAGVDAAVREELRHLASEFFKDGVFVHDQMSFQDFVEDLGDVLEDMVEGDEDEDEEEEDSDVEEDVEEFERAIMKRFSVPRVGVKEKRSKGEWRKESGRGHG